MIEYIRRDALMDDIEKRYCREGCKKENPFCRACWVDDMLGEIEDAPAADVVEVVRCKDCKYSFVGRGVELKCDALYPSLSWVENDDFCSWGKRKDGAE